MADWADDLAKSTYDEAAGGGSLVRVEKASAFTANRASRALNPEDNMLIRNPISWSANQVEHVAGAVKSAVDAIHRPEEALRAPRPIVREITIADLGAALKAGFEDFKVYRTDVITLCALYPVIGLVLARIVIGRGMFELMFPVASGFALIGPFVALGLYEMSRRREQGGPVSWATAFDVLRSRSVGGIAVLGFLLLAIFLIWVTVARQIYDWTLGPGHPAAITAFAQELFLTGAGWTLIVAGVGVGFLFAVVVFVISVVSFPLLLDRTDVGVDVAIGTSIRAVLRNPGTMAAWGLIIAGGLVLGSIPLFVGLAVVIPVLGHATWHLYRRVVTRE